MARGDQRDQFIRGFALGFAAGAIGGGLAALLLAPTSGKVLRENIRSKADGVIQEMGLDLPDDKEPWSLGDDIDALALGTHRILTPEGT